jgi:hypothetical protein
MRIISDHVGNPINDKLEILAIGAGPGGAAHHYQVLVPNGAPMHVHLNFQNGGINEVGVNGITQEALLAIVIDRLRSFQAGPFACSENQEALMHSQEALRALHARTKERIARGVEGFTKK